MSLFDDDLPKAFEDDLDIWEQRGVPEGRLLAFVW